MTKPKLTPDQLEDHLMDIEGGHQRALALTMLSRIAHGWLIVDDAVDGSDASWWYFATVDDPDDHPMMQLTADEQALWTALLRGAMVRQRKDGE
jgi:hypothetical protein